MRTLRGALCTFVPAGRFLGVINARFVRDAAFLRVTLVISRPFLTFRLKSMKLNEVASGAS